MSRFWVLGLAAGLILSGGIVQEVSASVAGKTYTITIYPSNYPQEEWTFSTAPISEEVSSLLFLTGDGLFGSWSESVGFFGRLSRFEAAASIDGTGDIETLLFCRGIRIGTYLIGGAYSEAYKVQEEDLGIVLFVGSETSSEE